MNVELTAFNGRLPLLAITLGVLSLLGACATSLQTNEAGAKPGDLSVQLRQNNQPVLPQTMSLARLGDPVLDNLIALAVENNQDLQIAAARVEQANATQARTALNKLPTFDVGASASRDRASVNDARTRAQAAQPGFERSSSTYRLDGTFNWDLNLYGRKDALQSADDARAKAAEANEQDIRLAVVTDVAKNVITARTLQTRIKLANEAAASEGEIVAITRSKLRGGQTSRADLLRALSLEQDSQATAARLLHDYGETIKTLAILVAERPDVIRAKLSVELEPGSYPKAVSSIMATQVPPDLLRHRPDVRRAEFQLAGASKDLAASNAERFPTFRIDATLALVAGSVAKLGGLASLLTSVAPAISWRAFDFGRLDAEIALAKGLEKEALITFRKSVTTALAEADTALDDIARRQTVLELTAASAAAQSEAWQVVQIQYERGVADLTTALDTKRGLYRSQESNALALQEQLLAVVTTFRVLGGSW